MCQTVPTEGTHSIPIHVAYATLEDRTVAWALVGTVQAELEGRESDLPLEEKLRDYRPFIISLVGPS